MPKNSIQQARKVRSGTPSVLHSSGRWDGAAEWAASTVSN